MALRLFPHPHDCPHAERRSDDPGRRRRQAGTFMAALGIGAVLAAAPAAHATTDENDPSSAGATGDSSQNPSPSGPPTGSDTPETSGPATDPTIDDGGSDEHGATGEEPETTPVEAGPDPDDVTAETDKTDETTPSATGVSAPAGDARTPRRDRNAIVDTGGTGMIGTAWEHTDEKDEPEAIDEAARSAASTGPLPDPPAVTLQHAVATAHPAASVPLSHASTVTTRFVVPPRPPARPATVWALLSSLSQQFRRMFSNIAPTVARPAADTGTVENTGRLRGILGITDADGDLLSVTVSVPRHGRVTVGADGTLTYDPVDSYRGDDSFVVTASDAADPRFRGLSAALTGNRGLTTTRVIDVVVAGASAAVSGVPGTPAAPTLTPRATSIVASWTPPAGGGSAITRYSLRYRQLGGTWTLAPDAPGTATSATIAGLRTNTDYEVSVRASNATGNSPWSASRPTHTGGVVVDPGPGPVTPPPAGVLWSDRFDSAPNGQLTKVTGDALFGPTGAPTSAGTYAHGSIHADPAGGKLLRQSIPAGGLGAFIVSPKLVRPTDHAVLSYDIRFDENFDWRWGGKIPGLVGVAPGHSIYEPTSGNADRSVGFSTRLMWHGRGDDGTRPFQGKLGPIPAAVDNDLVTYIYARNPSAGFNGYGWHASLRSALQRGKWHRITMEVKLNRVGAQDGVFKVWVDNTLRYSANNWSYRDRADVMIQAVLYDVHRGGGTTPPSWVSSRNTHVDIRNMTVTQV